ncbi:transcription elongation factor [Jiulongibacter sp. NS-SX5]|uniref:transcription elongation factor n=1 Tax=Jiulongibacter sp. NS-SX5 TaxID=3463854 RepID=UPI00405900D0
MKQEIILAVRQKVQLRLDEADKAMKAAQAAANEETKSSAGDKYETGRAMAQNDRDMYARQAAEAKNELAVLDNIKSDQINNSITVGSLVKTTIGKIYIAVSIGFITLGKDKIMVVSEESPIGKALKGKKAGEAFEFRGQQIKISEID